MLRELLLVSYTSELSLISIVLGVNIHIPEGHLSKYIHSQPHTFLPPLA